MIVPTHHHAQRGTHSADALLEWLADKSWTPFSRETLEADLRLTPNEGPGLLPKPHLVWTRGTDRVAASTVRTSYWHGPDRMRELGFRLQRLFDLGDVIEFFRDTVGFRCRVCREVTARSGLAEFPSIYEPDRDALCAICANQVKDALRGDKRARDALVKMPWQVRAARDAVRRLLAPERRLTRATRDDLKTIAEALGLRDGDCAPHAREN